MSFATKMRHLAVTTLVMAIFTAFIFYICYKLHLLLWLAGFYVLAFVVMIVEMRKADRECEKRDND